MTHRQVPAFDKSQRTHAVVDSVFATAVQEKDTAESFTRTLSIFCSPLASPPYSAAFCTGPCLG